MLIPFLTARLAAPEGERSARPSPKLFRSPGSGPTRSAILLVGVSQAPQERAGKTACLGLKQRVEVVVHFLGPPFYERDGISACGFRFTISVEPNRPQRRSTPLIIKAIGRRVKWRPGQGSFFMLIFCTSWRRKERPIRMADEKEQRKYLQDCAQERP